MNANERRRAKRWIPGLLLFALCAVLALPTAEAASSQGGVDRPSSRTASQSFQESQQQWQLTWNDWTGCARAGVASQGPLAAPVSSAEALRSAEAFLEQHAMALGTDGVQLRRVRHRFSGQLWLTTWIQEWSGAPVVDAFVDLTLRADGSVLAFRSSLRPQLQVRTGTGTVDQSLAISRKALGTKLRIESMQPCVVVPPTGIEGIAADEIILSNDVGARWRVRVSRVDGSVLETQDLLRTETISGRATGRVSLHYFREDQIEVNLPWLQVFQSSDREGPSTFTDRQGWFTLSAPAGTYELHADLAGRFVKVTNQAGDAPPHATQRALSPGDAEINFNAVNSRADERSIYFHTNYVHDQYKDRFGFTLLDYSLPAIANAFDPSTGDPNYPNAYWNGLWMGFGNGGGTFFNMGQHADVIYHEYSHAVTDFIYRPVGGLNNLIGASMHEGFSDYFSASFTEDPLLGERLLRNRDPYLRRIDDWRVWPDDMDMSFQADVHANGLILAGALWDLRKVLGAEITDPLAHHARELLPRNYQEYFEAVLLQDDALFGDAIPGNGSPHHDVILQAFGGRGLGPLGAQPPVILHTPLQDTEDADLPRQVRARLASMREGPDQAMRMFWSNGGGFEGLWMAQDEQGEFRGTIPSQAEGTTVRYYIRALELPPLLTTVLPASAPDEFFEYKVGPDEQAPSIAHVAVGQHAAFTGAPQIEATIIDGSGIDHAWLQYRLDDGTEGSAGMVRGDPAGNNFTAALPIPLTAGRSFQYRIHATDRSRAAHETISPASDWHVMTIVDELMVDFEPHDGGWSHHALLLDRADSWKWSSVTNHSLGGAQAWCCQTAASPTQRTAAVLETPAYRLGQAASASVWSWMRATVSQNGAVDAGQVQIQVDGGDWQPLTPSEGYTHQIDANLQTNYLPPGSACLSGTDPTWRPLTFDLAAWVGRTVRLRFLFASAAPVVEETSEWFLDDFTLQPGSPRPTDVGIPAVSGLLLRQQPSPNPFNPAVVFVLQAQADLPSVRLEILDAQGREVRRLLQGPLSEGEHRHVWDGRNGQGLASASGVYYYLLESSLGRQTGKLVLLK